MSKPTVFMFSGQGSHYYHMGRELYNKNSEFRKKIMAFDAVATDILGYSVVASLYDHTKTIGDIFDQPQITTPAIVMVEYALAKLLIENGVEPDLILGTSLGETTAMLLAEVLTLDDILEEAKIRLELIDRNCKRGKMIAVMAALDLYENTPWLKENSELAGIYCDSHFVVSCSDSTVQKIEKFLKKNETAYQILSVSHAFHSSLLDPVKNSYMDCLKRYTRKAPYVPVVSCATIGEVTTFDEKYCWRILRDPILFQKTIQKMEIMQDYFYIDLGPSGTLAAFAGYNLKEGSTSEIFPVLTPFGNNAERLNKVLNTYKSSKNIKKVKTMKTEMTSYLFPGQGSQKKGMGGALFDEFDDVAEKADNILGYSIKELCLIDPKKQLSQTQYTQPALFVVNALWYFKMCEQDDRTPDFVAGHSLGEYNALLAAGGIDFETGLKLVKKRGELMGKAVGGGMAAVLNLDEGQVEKLLQVNDLHSIDIANYNTPSQIVIAGPKQDIERAQSIFESAGGRYIPLNVSAAFHSRYMQQARDEFKSFLSGFEFSDLNISLISNVHAKPYNNQDIVVNLADQLRMPVRWTESIRYLLGQGDMHFEEIGSGAVLTNMVNKIQN